MSEVDYNIISTGSQGNAVLLEKKVLIDFGVPYKQIVPYMDGIKLVLATHQHSDHFKASTARRIAHEKPLVRFGCGSWMAKLLVDAGVSKSQIDVLQERMLYGYGICNVIPVEVFHDVRNYAYKVHFPNGKVFYATDCGNLNGITARDYSLLMIEANFEDEEIKARMDAKRADGQYVYEQRVLKYHLSKKQADDFIYKNAGRHTEYVYLHCHTDRNSDTFGN